MSRGALCSIALCACLFACTDQDSKSPPTAGEGSQTGSQTGTSSPGSGSEVAQSGCAPGATRNTEGGFCIVVPSDHQASAATTQSPTEQRYQYGSGASTIVVIVRTGATADAFASAKAALEAEASSMNGHTRSYLENVSGTWSVADGRTTSTTIMRKDGTILDCRATSTNAVALQACQTLRFL